MTGQDNRHLAGYWWSCYSAPCCANKEDAADLVLLEPTVAQLDENIPVHPANAKNSPGRIRPGAKASKDKKRQSKEKQEQDKAAQERLAKERADREAEAKVEKVARQQAEKEKIARTARIKAEEEARDKAIRDRRLGELAKDNAFIEVFLDDGWQDVGEDQFKQICDHVGGDEEKFSILVLGTLYVVDWSEPSNPKQINARTQKERQLRVRLR